MGTGIIDAPAGQLVYVLRGPPPPPPPPLPDAVPDDDGQNVIVSPSVVITVGLVRPVGTGIVSVPMMISPELDTIVLPSGSVDISGPVACVLECELDGTSVNVRPSVVIVVGDDTLGSVTVPEPGLVPDPPSPEETLVL